MRGEFLARLLKEAIELEKEVFFPGDRLDRDICIIEDKCKEDIGVLEISHKAFTKSESTIGSFTTWGFSLLQKCLGLDNAYITITDRRYDADTKIFTFRVNLILGNETLERKKRRAKKLLVERIQKWVI